MKRLPVFGCFVSTLYLIAAIAGGVFMMLAAGCGPTNGFPELAGEFAYVANAGDGSISVFSIDTTSGALTLIEPVSVKPGFRVFGLALHPSNEFLYATIDDANQVESFDIGDGSFSGQIFAHNGPFPAVNGPRAVALAKQGQYLFATNDGGIAQVVSQYTVDQHTGVLTANGTAPTGVRPFGIAANPAGTCVYVANTGDHNLSTYGVTSTGTLDPGPNVALGGTSEGQGPELVAVQNNPGAGLGSAPSIYVTDDDLQVVHHVSVIARFIGETCNTETPTDYPAKGKAIGLALHPKGTFLYTANSSSNTISIFSVGASGALTFVGQESANLSDPLSVAIDLQGDFLYAANLGNGTVAQFKINQATGKLTPIGSGKVNTENPANSSSAPITIVTTISNVAVLHRL
jgi:6-phosphogluconolactonase (cycloisomerase 2 family)